MEGFNWQEAEVQEAEAAAVPLAEAEEAADEAVALEADFQLEAAEVQAAEAAVHSDAAAAHLEAAEVQAAQAAGFLEAAEAQAPILDPYLLPGCPWEEDSEADTAQGGLPEAVAVDALY